MSVKKVNVSGKSVLVTGSNRGIGKAIVEELFAQGASTIYAAARNISSLNELISEYGDKIIPLELDVTDQSSVLSAKEKVKELDIIINNAGVLAGGEILSENARSEMETNFNVNVWGVFNVVSVFTELLNKEEPTAIVNISSMAGIGNMPVIGTYSVSKAAVHSITQGLRAELADSKTLVSGVYPGPIDTDMTKALEMPKDTVENVAKSIVEGITSGVEDIYPDQMSVIFGAAFEKSPKGVEQEFGQFA